MFLANLVLISCQFQQNSGHLAQLHQLGTSALSAINRATTAECRQELADVACRLKKGQLTPKWLPNSCPRKEENSGRSLGCFFDDAKTPETSHLLPPYGVQLPQLTVQMCVDLCAKSSYPYAGVRNGRECHCGDGEPRRNNVTVSCDVPCNGLASQTCGGMSAMEVFTTGMPGTASLESIPANVTATTRIAFVLTLNGRASRQVR